MAARFIISNTMILTCLIRFVVLTLGTCQALNPKKVQPYGPKMCERLCQEASRCAAYTFDLVQLSCCLDSSSVCLNLSRNASSQLDVTLSDVKDECTSQKMETMTRNPGINETEDSYFTHKSEKTRKKRRLVCPAARVERLLDASAKGKLHVVKKILSKKLLNVNCSNYFGFTAVMVAAQRDRRKIFDFLVQHKCDLSAMNIAKRTVLHFACFVRSCYIVKKLLNDISKYIDFKDCEGVSPLMRAVSFGHLKMTKLFVKSGADIRTKDDQNNTLLHVACERTSYRMVKLVLSLNITDIDTRGESGRTPLLKAVFAGTLRIVKLLIESGADVNKVDDSNDNILHAACRSNSMKMVKYILPLKHAEIDCRGYLGKTPMMYAVEISNEHIVKFLRKRGADIKTVDNVNNTILHWACAGGSLNMIRYVSSLKVSKIETIGGSGRTPVMFAVQHGHIKAVRFLIKHYKAKITTTDDDGQTVLHIACQADQLDMVKYLLTLEEVRAMQKKKNKAGETPHDLATKNEHFEIESYLDMLDM